MNVNVNGMNYISIHC